MRAYLTVLLIPTLVITLVGCMAIGGGLEEALPEAGTDRYQLREMQLHSSHGCRFKYRLFEPVNTVSDDLIVLGHGFLRSQDTLVQLSRALANQGVRTATLDFCNMQFWNGHHQRNADDMRLVAQSLGTEGGIIYAGFSAGALAALLAADNTTRAVITLDLVDQSGLGLRASQRLRIPVLGLHGPASACNAENNGLPIFNQNFGQRLTVLVPDASHCEFEAPTNWLCEMTCGDQQKAAVNNFTRTAIIEQTVDLITSQLVMDTPGSSSAVPAQTHE